MVTNRTQMKPMAHGFGAKGRQKDRRYRSIVVAGVMMFHAFNCIKLCNFLTDIGISEGAWERYPSPMNKEMMI